MLVSCLDLQVCQLFSTEIESEVCIIGNFQGKTVPLTKHSLNFRCYDEFTFQHSEEKLLLSAVRNASFLKDNKYGLLSRSLGLGGPLTQKSVNICFSDKNT